MKRVNKYIYWVLLGAIFIYYIIPLITRGFIPTHDGEYHLIRIYEFSRMLRAGYWFPRWAAGLNSGYGLPLFNFFYPFPNYVGSFFHLVGFSLADSFKLTLATGYGIATLATFFWLKKVFGGRSAFVATIVFISMPYWFVDIYVRGSVGEVFALAWTSWIFMCVEYRKPLFVALCVCLLVLSHNILAMIFLPIASVYILLKSREYIWYVLGGIAMSAYFWIPALFEKKYVTGLNTVNYLDHFPLLAQLLIPSWGTGFSRPGYFYDEMSFQVGISAILVILLSFFLIIKFRSLKQSRIVIFFLFLDAISLLFMLEQFAFFWKLFPFLQFMQYPWRLLSVLVITTAYLAAFVASKTNMKVAYLIMFIAVFFGYLYSKPVKYESRSDSYYLSKKEFTEGTSSLGNSFNTIWFQWRPNGVKNKIEVTEGSPTIKNFKEKILTYSFDLESNIQSKILINTAYYPGWTVRIDGRLVPIDYTKGLLNILAPLGSHHVVVGLEETLLRKSADLVSVLSLIIIVVSLVFL